MTSSMSNNSVDPEPLRKPITNPLEGGLIPKPEPGRRNATQNRNRNSAALMRRFQKNKSSSDSSNSTRSGPVAGGRMPPPTIASEPHGALTPPQPTGGALPVVVAAPPEQPVWSGQHPMVVGIPAVGVPAGVSRGTV